MLLIRIIKKIVFKLYGLKIFLFGTREFLGVKILLYHDIDNISFSKHINYLSSHYNIISLEEMLTHFKSGKELKNTFVITFDDGIKENFRLLDTIIFFKIKPTIFITGNVDTNNFFWFSGLNQNKLIELLSLDNKERLNLLNENSEKKQISERESLNKDEINQMKEYVDFQPHTISHPSLIKCTEDEINEEVSHSCKLVNELTGLKASAFAPPFGIYDKLVIKSLKTHQIKCCLTIKPGVNSGCDDLYSLKRIGIPQFCDINEFIIRVDGIWDRIRSLSIFKRYSSFYAQYYE